MLARPLGVAPLVAGKLLRRPDQTLDECAIGAGDAHSPARLQHAPAFGEHAPAALVRHVLDHVLAKGAVKLGVGKGKGPCRVHPQDVMPARIEIGVDPAVERMVAAANVQFFHRGSCSIAAQNWWKTSWPLGCVASQRLSPSTMS